MKRNDGGRILPILAAVLLVLALAVGLALFLFRAPPNQIFEESLLFARQALERGSISLMKREILRASKYANTASNWMEMLTIAASAIPQDAEPQDYRLFATIATRGAAIFPGNTNLRAYLIWGLLRSGHDERALTHLPAIEETHWTTLRSEVRLHSSHLLSIEEPMAFDSMLEFSSDPDFLAQTGLLTGSAEISFDAALLYMKSGRTEQAFREASLIMNNRRHWNNSDLVERRGVVKALAAIAVDSGNREEALAWLEIYLEDARRRRTLSWESLQLLGDLHWDQFSFFNDIEARVRAAEAWREAMGLLRDEKGNVEFQEDSWKLWVNLALLEQSAGNIVLAREILDEALRLFPQQSEVKAAWARHHYEENPALARRLLRLSKSDAVDPVLAIAAIDIDPDAISPRLYEARLWQLFEAVASSENGIQSVDRRSLVTFLLDYLASRRNVSSLDIAIDRYRKSYPDEAWILAWRLAADAEMGFAIANLITPESAKKNNYERFRHMARSQRNWRALHDSAMFAVLAAEEIEEATRFFPNEGLSMGDITAETGVLFILVRIVDMSHPTSGTLNDRIERLLRERDDLRLSLKELTSMGRVGERSRSQAHAALAVQSDSLLENALEDIALALDNPSISDTADRIQLLKLKSVALKKAGRLSESAAISEDILELYPDSTAGIRLDGISH